jgi:ribosomal protein S18 acetylase RimI-like enzyme
MQIETTDRPREEDEAFVIAQTREYNSAFTENDVRRLCVFVRNESGSIVGGLTAKTYWRYLDIGFLWVSAKHRGQDLGSKLMDAAESEARARGCERALLDTLSFQALEFYKKRGYTEFGRLNGFSGKYDRHYLFKQLN